MNKINRFDNDENTVMKFILLFFSTYDENRIILYSLFVVDGTFTVLGNCIAGHEAIHRAMTCTMVDTTHDVLNIDIHCLSLSLAENISMFNVLCAGTVKFIGDPQFHEFTATFLVSFQKPNTMKVVSFNERFQWPKLS